MARDLLKQYDSSYDVDTLTDNLSKVFDVVANGGLTWDEASSAVVDMCRKVLEESSSFDAELYDYDQPVREYLKNVRLEIGGESRCRAAASLCFFCFDVEKWEKPQRKPCRNPAKNGLKSGEEDATIPS